jgi:hypothetical protein
VAETLLTETEVGGRRAINEVLLGYDEPRRVLCAVELVGGVAEEVEDKLKAFRVELRGLRMLVPDIVYSKEYVTYVNTIQLLVLTVVISAVTEGHALPTKDESVREQAEQDRLGQVHDRITVDGEALAAEVEVKAGKQLGLEAHPGRDMLRDLGYRRA